MGPSLVRAGPACFPHLFHRGSILKHVKDLPNKTLDLWMVVAVDVDTVAQARQKQCCQYCCLMCSSAPFTESHFTFCFCAFSISQSTNTQEGNTAYVVVDQVLQILTHCSDKK